MRVYIERILMIGTLAAIVSGGYFFANALYLEPYDGDSGMQFFWAIVFFGLTGLFFVLHYHISNQLSWRNRRGMREEIFMGVVVILLMVVLLTDGEVALLFIPGLLVLGAVVLALTWWRMRRIEHP